MPQRLRIFISSPADVPDERLRADLIIDKLSQDYGRFFSIESYRWEHETMLASAHFQDAIEPPSAFDIVVLILWSRLGTPLPEKTPAREYRGIDGRAPVTGTEWEYEEALKAAREKKAPDLLAFRNISPVPIDPRDADAQAESIAQLNALNAFWARHFADRGVFLAAFDEYRKPEEFAQRLEQSLRKLIERRIKDISAGDSRSEPIWLGDPFRGLEPYEFEHAPIFFGRDASVMKATEQLAANARSRRAFLLVSGASGSGKSSLVKAGIVPRLMKPQRISGMAFLRRAVFRPGAEGADVILGLAKALTRAAGQDVGLPELIAPGQDAAQLAAHLRGAVGKPGFLFANALGRLTQAGRASDRLLAFEDGKLILIIDQLEELYTVHGISAEERRLFIQLLAGLAHSGAVWVIATLRLDFWPRAAEIAELTTLAEGQGRIELATPSAAELAEMIRKPAQAAGLSFEGHPESGLGLDVVLAEHAAAAPGALPLLSFTLDELYKSAKARSETVLTHASYEALGGLEGAIAKRADEIVGGLPTAAQVALPRVLRALTTVTGTAEQAPVGRSAPLERFAEGSPARTLIDAFIAARLLVAASDGGAAATMRLAHEALISRWQRARDQLAADDRDLGTRTLVERQFGRWSKAHGRARRLLLLRNPDLANAVDLAGRWGDEIDAPTRNFIKRSARRARLAQTLTAAAAILFAMAAGAAFYAERQAVSAQQEAEQQRQRAKESLETARELAHSMVDLGQQRDSPPEMLLGEIFDQAIKGFGELISLNPSDATLYDDRGYAHNDKGDWDSAIKDFNQAILLDSKDASAFLNRGWAFAAKHDRVSAIKDYSEVIKLDPKYIATKTAAFLDRAYEYNAEGDSSNAIADYNQAIKLDPNDAVSFYYRGAVYYAEGEFDHAIADFTGAIKLIMPDPKPMFAYVFRDRGNAYVTKGDLDHAVADFTQAIILDPEDADAYSKRCWARVIVGQQLQEALVDCNESLRIRRDDADTLNSRAFAYLKLDQLDNAIVDFNAALEINPKLARSLYGRGLAKLMKGDHAGADADMAAAEAINLDIAEQVRGYGIK